MAWIRRVALVLAVLMVATGCGDDTDDPQTEQDPTDAPNGESGGGESDPQTTISESEVDNGTQTPEGSTELNGTDWSTASPEEITLLLFGSPDGTKPGIQKHFEEQERVAEQAISECMRKEGFDYTPKASLDDSLAAIFEFELDSREFAEKYGLAVTTTDSVQFINGALQLSIVDPNLKYLESLSGSEQNAYYVALYGQAAASDSMTDDEDPEDTPSATSEESPGCVAETLNRSVEFPNFERVFEVFVDDLNEINQEMLSDQRLVDLMTKWSGCMADKGHSYAEINDLLDDVTSRQQDLMASLPDPFEEMSESEIDELEPEEMDALLEGARPDDEQLTELREYEIAVAVDSWDCGIYDHDDVTAEMFNDYVGGFVSDNLDKIRSLLIEE